MWCPICPAIHSRLYSEFVGRLGRLGIGIEVGPEDARRRGRQEILVYNGFRRISAVVVGQPVGRHLLVGGGEVFAPCRGGVWMRPSRRRSGPGPSVSARRRAPRPHRSAPAACRRTPCRRPRGSVAARPAREMTSAATTHRGRPGGWALDRVDHRDAADGHPPVQLVDVEHAWRQVVDVRGCHTGDVGGHRRDPANSSYHPRSIG